jgi:hypothetical protein
VLGSINGVNGATASVKVGIGTSTPAKTLDVAGTIKMNDLYFVPPSLYDPAPTITSRVIPAGQGEGPEKSELILFHSNDATDQIALRAPAISFQTYNSSSVHDISNNAGYHPRMYIMPDGRVGIGTTDPEDCAILDVSSTTQGFLLPRMTTTQRNAISNPITGLIIWNTSDLQVQVYNGTSWTEAAP